MTTKTTSLRETEKGITEKNDENCIAQRIFEKVQKTFKNN